MPGPFTHIYEARRVADFLAAQGAFVRPEDGDALDGALLAPAANAAAYAATMQKWPKFTSLGAIGPDLFFFLADFHEPFDDAVMLAMRAGYKADAFNLKLDDPDPANHPSWNGLADVFRTHPQVQAANLIDAYATMMPLWRQFTNVWQLLVDTWGALASEDLDILSGQLFSAVGEAFSTTVKAYLAKRLLDVVAQVDFLAFFSLGLQKGVDEKDFFWSDMLHYRRTSEMAAALFTRAKNYAGPDAANRREQLQAYALGYGCHVATDVAGHPFVNEQCGGPFRTHWQRHHMVENHIDAWNYRETKPGHSLPRDAYCGATDDYPELCQSALYFAVQLKENDAGGDLRRPLPPVDRNLVPAPGDPKGLTPQQRRLRTEALDTDGDMPEWLAVEILRALLDTYGGDARATPPLAPLNLKGFAFQTDVVEPIWHDDYTNKYGLSADTVPRGFPLPWQIQVSYKFMLSYFKRGFMDGFDLPKPSPPQATAAHTDSAVTGTQLAAAVARTRAALQELAAGIAANAGRIKADLNLPDDTYLADAQAGLHAAMSAFDGAVGAMQALAVFVDTPVRMFFDAISLATLQYRTNLYNGVTIPMWTALRGVRKELVQRGFLTPQDAEFLPDGTQLHDTEIDRRHVQLGYTGAPVPVTVETGYNPVYVASQSDGAGTWSGGFSVIGGSNGRRFAVGTNGDGRLEAFAIGTDGVVHHAWQNTPNGSWGGWSALTPIFNVDAVDLAVTTNLNGRLEVFALGADYGIYHTWQMFANSFWSPGWQRIGPVTAVGVDLAAGIGARDLLNALVVGTDGNVYHAMQTSLNGTFSDWSRVGDTFSDKAVRVVTGRGADRALSVVVVDERGGLHASAQSADASSFSLFVPLLTSVPVSTVRGAVACATDRSGTFTVAACGINGELFVFARPAGGSFGSPAAIHTPKLRAVAVALAPNADGTLEAVALAADSTIWAARNASGTWSAWQQVGNPWDKGKSVRLVPNHDGRLQAFVDGVPVSTEAAVQGSRNPQSAVYPLLPVDDEFTQPSAYPDHTRTGAPNAIELPRATAGPFAQDTLAHVLLRTDGPADNDARRLYEQAQTPHETDCLNEQFVGHGDAQRNFTNPLGSPVLFSAYLIGRLNGGGSLPVNFNLDSDRAYGYLCWDWTRHAGAPGATGYNGQFVPPLVWPRVQPDSKMVGGTAGVWAQAAAAWQKQGGDMPLQLHYVSGPVPPPTDASASPDTCTPLGSLAVAVVPAAIPVGQPVTVTITATDDRSGHPAHAWVVIGGRRVARAGTAFTSTFNGDERVVVTAYGYASAAVALPFNRMRVTVAPTPTLLGTLVQLTVTAADARTGGAVPGAIVALVNFDEQGDSADAQFPAGVPYPVVLRAAPGDAVGKARFKVGEKPSASVRAPGYAETEVSFNWTTVRPPPKRMTVTVSPTPITVGSPVSVTVRAVDAASGAAVTGTVLIAGAAAGTTGTPFSYTFGASAPEAHVSANGYADAPIAWPPFYTPTLNVTFEPASPAYGKPVQVVVHAVDARSGATVAGTVTLMNYSVGGAIVTTQFPTNTATVVTLRMHRIPGGKGNPPDVRFPTLTVAATGYATATVALGDASDA